MPHTILVIDHDVSHRGAMTAALRRFGYDVLAAEHNGHALALLDAEAGARIGAIVLDLTLTNVGPDILAALAARGRQLPVIVQTTSTDTDTLERAIREGASDFVVKPVQPERLRMSLRNALRVHALEREVRKAERRSSGSMALEDFAGRSPAMTRVVELARRAARSRSPILIEGEQGVGKEALARAIHGASERRAKPFIALESAGLTALLPHVLGAGPGGKGLQASLYLAEVGLLPSAVQDELARLLHPATEARQDPRDKAPRGFGGRLIVGSSRPLLDLVRAGRFREDLYFGLAATPLTIPPLRARPEDIAPLARSFLARFAVESGAAPIELGPDMLALMAREPWPGNISQLEQAMRRALIGGDPLIFGGIGSPASDTPWAVARNVGAYQHHPAASTADGEAQMAATALDQVFGDRGNASADTEDGWGAIPAGEPHPDSFPLIDPQGDVRRLADIEAGVIRFALRHYHGHMSEVSRRLGIGRSTLYRKLKEFGLEGALEGADTAHALSSAAHKP